MFVLLGASAVFGNTITVVSTQDGGPGSLRDAIASAAPGDTIDFNVPLPATITVGTPLTFGPSVTISGPGSDSLAINGGDSVVVFLVNAGATVNISSLRIEHGSSLLGGGVFNAGTLTLTGVTVADNTEGTQLGGGIFNAGTLTLTGCSVVNNSAERGGGLYNDDTTVTIEGSSFVNNSAVFGGGLYNHVEQGQAMVTVDQGLFESNHAVSTTSLVGLGGGAYIDGGTMIVTDSSFLDNSASVGGGFNTNGGTLTVSRSTVSGNTAAIAGGGFDTGGALTVMSSTIAFNTTTGEVGGGAGIVSGNGLTLINSTIARNIANGLSGGGGIWNQGESAVISNSTIWGNLAIGGGGGILNDPSLAQLTIKNSIVANNSIGGNCASSGDFNSDGHNLSDDGTCVAFFTQTGDLNNTAAGLDPNGLNNNGGPTETVALQATSPAVNAIPLSSCTDTSGAPITTDQRGVPRPQGPACDIGALEFFRSRFPILAVQTFSIIGAVQSSPLPPGVQHGLISPLQATVDSLNRGDVNPAMNQLGAFINETGALVRSGTLTSAQASAFTTPAQNIIQALTSGPGGGTLQE